MGKTEIESGEEYVTGPDFEPFAQLFHLGRDSFGIELGKLPLDALLRDDHRMRAHPAGDKEQDRLILAQHFAQGVNVDRLLAQNCEILRRAPGQLGIEFANALLDQVEPLAQFGTLSGHVCTAGDRFEQRSVRLGPLCDTLLTLLDHFAQALPRRKPRRCRLGHRLRGRPCTGKLERGKGFAL